LYLIFKTSAKVHSTSPENESGCGRTAVSIVSGNLENKLFSFFKKCPFIRVFHWRRGPLQKESYFAEILKLFGALDGFIDGMMLSVC